VMRIEPVDTASLVAEIIQNMRPELQGRTIEWTIHPLPTVSADATLIKQVLVNLIDNAVKYSRLQAVAKIEIGSREEPEETVFFVKDNGVGFDMTYAAKLFQVFQRLHKESEFEGHGIGLANVKRIILRHGGRVWTDSKEGFGATFYFSLPKEIRRQSGGAQN
jgi:two-component system, chemotaxis family, sensor kinase Cph1